MVKSPKIGEIYLMKFNGNDSEQAGWRPGLVFQNNTGNKHSPNIIALPLTSVIKKASQPTHVVVPKSFNGLKHDSMILCENPERMSKNKIGGYITSLTPKDMEKVAKASLLASSAISYINFEELITLHARAKKLNNVS